MTLLEDVIKSNQVIREYENIKGIDNYIIDHPNSIDKNKVLIWVKKDIIDKYWWINQFYIKVIEELITYFK